jgi:uncharacterized protein
MHDFAWDRSRFDWDQSKAEQNLKDHDGVSFPEATTVFADPRLLGPVFDEDHSEMDEDHWIVQGWSARGRPLTVVYCERGVKIRIISAWALRGSARRTYHEDDL